VGLLEALDPDIGIGYARLHQEEPQEGLLDGIRFPPREVLAAEIGWTPVHRLLIRIWLAGSGRTTYEPVEIRDSDVAALPPATLAPPPSLAVLCSCCREGLLIENAGGATATALTGRFSAFGPEFAGFCREIAGAEINANPGIVLAELHQLSHGHVDNINRRQQLYDYVIPVNTFPGESRERQLYPDELTLRLAGGELILESARLGKRVVPRLPTAYNFKHNDMPLFRLLCDLQYDGLLSDLNFDPERLFPGLDFYPRFIYRSTVLSLARWYLRAEELKTLTAGPGSLGRLHLFCRDRGIPRYISFGKSDQQLVFDLGNDGEAWLFLECLRDPGDAVIREYLFPDGSVVAAGKPFAGQWVAAMTREETVYHTAPPAPPGEAVTRDFPPGTEWLYLKIYSTRQSADILLLELLAPFLERYQGDIRSWFFIRYEDPEPHLRLRLKAEPGLMPGLQVALQAQLTSHEHGGLVRNFYADTYQRELERFGPELMELTEAVFFAGSAWALAFLEGQGTLAPLLPFRLILDSCQWFIGDAGELLAFLGRVTANFLWEFRKSKTLNPDLAKRYREISRELDGLMRGPGEPVMNGLWLEWSGRLADLRLAATDRTQMVRERLLADLCHLQINRLYAERQRQHEALIWYCLHRYVRSAQKMGGRRGE
jgi:thiopeptide-type bacteriocin biosynthesis protein